jgi:hypothetical protein
MPIQRGARDHAAPLCLALEPAASQISLGRQNALPGAEGLTQTEARAVQETAKLPQSFFFHFFQSFSLPLLRAGLGSFKISVFYMHH